MLVFAREVTVSCKYTDAHDAGRGEYYRIRYIHASAWEISVYLGTLATKKEPEQLVVDVDFTG